MRAKDSGRYRSPALLHAGPRSLRLCAAALLLALTSNLPSVVRASSAHTGSTVRYVLEAHRPQSQHGAICAGFSYPVRVTLKQIVQTRLVDGQMVVPENARGVATTINASSLNPGVGTVDPDSKDTGLGASNALAQDTVFTFHAESKGETTLVFNAETPGGEAGDSVTVEVENCKYNVHLVAFSVVLGDGYNIWTAGHSTTQIADDGSGKYKGSGGVIFNAGFGGAPCSITYSSYHVPMTVTAPGVQDGKLTLTFTYGPAKLANTVSCPLGGGTGSHTYDFNKLHIPPTEFPAAGGNVVHRLYYEGSDAGDTTVILKLELVGE